MGVVYFLQSGFYPVVCENCLKGHWSYEPFYMLRPIVLMSSSIERLLTMLCTIQSLSPSAL